MLDPSPDPNAVDPDAGVEVEAPTLGNAVARTAATTQEAIGTPIMAGVSVQNAPSPLGLALRMESRDAGEASPSLTLAGGDLPSLGGVGGIPDIFPAISGALEDANF